MLIPGIFCITFRGCYFHRREVLIATDSKMCDVFSLFLGTNYLCVCVHIHIYVCAHAYIYIYRHAHTHTHM